MKKADKILIILLVIVSVIGIFGVVLFSKTGNTVIIKKDNKQVYNGSLYYNETIDLGTNTIEIENGSVDMIYGSCKNQICVKHKKISKKDEQIVRLPNEIVITIE